MKRILLLILVSCGDSGLPLSHSNVNERPTRASATPQAYDGGEPLTCRADEAFDGEACASWKSGSGCCTSGTRLEDGKELFRSECGADDTGFLHWSFEDESSTVTLNYDSGTIFIFRSAQSDTTRARIGKVTSGSYWESLATATTIKIPLTATRLNSGRILVLGTDGERATDPVAEIYDPNQRRWFGATTPPSGVQSPTALTLPSGSVLVVGNGASVWNPDDPWKSADPIGDVPEGFFFQSASLLPDGRVLVIASWLYAVQHCAFVWDPKTTVWHETRSPESAYFDRHLIAGAMGMPIAMNTSFRADEPKFTTEQYVQRRK